MGISQTELDNFSRFVREKLHGGGAQLTLENCLRLWRTEQERAAAVQAIREGLEDVAAGRTRPAADAVDALQRELRERATA